MKKQSKKNTKLGTNNVKEDLSDYKKTKQTDIDVLRDIHYNPKANRSRNELKFLEEYIGFFRFFRNTFPYLDKKRRNKLLMNPEFTIANDEIKQNQKWLKESQTDDSLILAWEQYIEYVQELVDNVDPAFQMVISNYFMKSNKKIKDVLDSIQMKEKKGKLKDTYITRNDIPKY